MSVNKAILIGRLGKDPEVRRTNSGQAVARFSLATDEQWNDKNGERQKRTEWHNIVLWGKLAEISEQYLNKGKLVYIEGRIQTREYDDRDGNKRRITEVVAGEMRMLGSREDRDSSASNAPSYGSSANTRETVETTPPSSPPAITDDDIPF
ncbi:MAG: single-stranded DNA-binding protein [Acidobacteria bacterium]|nr:single-stranded DNA-binding protein [Acidobacteriota bacterium]MBI3654791.1 single-stranded DNA-binding protein [Acidobacteriota bacterium]